MAIRQDPSTPEENQVLADFETFFLPFDASLDLGDRTTYGTTDPGVNLSMVNIRHLNNTREFRGRWVMQPSDGLDADSNPLEVPYQINQIVVGNNELLYRRTAMSPTTNPEPGSASDTGQWTLIGRQVEVANAPADATNAPGLTIDHGSMSRSTITFHAYNFGSGLELENGTVRVTNLALTDVHTELTAQARNDELTITWHQGDTVIVTTDNDQVTQNVNGVPRTDGQGTYIYTGSNQVNPGATTNADWTMLALPGNVVNMVAGNPGPIVTTAQIITAIDNESRQILTDTEYTANAYKYAEAGPPGGARPATDGRTLANGDLYIDTSTAANTLYFYSNLGWHQANPATLDDVGDVVLGVQTGVSTSVALADDQHLVYHTDVDGQGNAGWRNQPAATIAGNNILLENLMDTSNVAPIDGQIIRRESGEWVYRNTINSDEDLQDFDSANPSTTGIPGTKIRNDTITGPKIQDGAIRAIQLTAPGLTQRTTERLIEWQPDPGLPLGGAWRYANHADILGANGISDLGDIPNEPTSGDPQFLQWDPSANSGAGAWSYVSQQEAAVANLVDVGDVDERQVRSPVTYAFDPMGTNLGTAEPVTDLDPMLVEINVPYLDIEDLSVFTVGQRVIFSNGQAAPNNVEQLNGGQGFEIRAIDNTAPGKSLTIRSPDGEIIPISTRNGISGLGTKLGVRSGGVLVDSPLADNEILAYNTNRVDNDGNPLPNMWENTPASEIGLFTTITAGEGSNQQTITSTTGTANILEATPERDGVLSSEDKLHIDHIPDAPQTADGMPISSTNPQTALNMPEHYALRVERTAATADNIPDQYTERWVNISDIVNSGGSPLRWTETTTGGEIVSTELTGYLDNAGVERTVTRTQINTQGDFILTLGIFNPILSNFPFSRQWDQPVTSIRGGVNNPEGVTQYISSINAISVSGTANSAVTLTDFTAGNFRNTSNTANVTPGPQIDWIQDFATTSILASGRTAAGETVTATLNYNQHDGTTETPFTTDTSMDVITWEPVSAGEPRATLPQTSINFYERVTTLNINASISGLSRPTNGRIDWVRNSGLSDSDPAPGISGTSLSRTYTLDNQLTKDRTQILSTDDATVTATIIVTRPADVAGTSYNVTLQNNADSNIPAALGVIMPFFRFTIDAAAARPTAYGTANTAVLGGEWSNTSNSLSLNSGVFRTTTIAGSSGLSITRTAQQNTTDTTYWFGLPSSTPRPDFSLAQPLPVDPAVTTHTVTFDDSFTGAPATGFTDVTYTFYGVRVSAGAFTLTVS